MTIETLHGCECRMTECWICGRLMILEDCKSDDRGKPVHEDCYVLLLRASEQTRSAA